MARFRVGVQLHPQATTVDELRAAWKAADGLGVDSIWTWDHFFPLYGDPDADALRGVDAAVGDGRRHHNARARTARRLQLVPQPRPARRHGAHGRPPLRRPAVPRHRCRAGSSATTTSTATSSAPRSARLRALGEALPAHRGAPRQAQPAARRSAPDPHRRWRREGHAAPRRRARRRVEHVRSARHLRAQERRARRAGARRSGAIPARSSGRSASPRTRSTTSRRTSTRARRT